MAWHHTTGASIRVHVPKPAMPKVPKPVTQKQAAPAPKQTKTAGPKPMTAKGKTAHFAERHHPKFGHTGGGQIGSGVKGIRH